MSDIFRAHSRCFASFLLLLFAVQWSALITDDLESSLVVTVSGEHHVSDASGEHSVGCDTDTECDHCCQCHNHGSHITLPGFPYDTVSPALFSECPHNRVTGYYSLYRPGIHRPPIA